MPKKKQSQRNRAKVLRAQTKVAALIEEVPINVGQTRADLSYDARVRTLDEARNAVLQDRNATHGNPEDNFKNIADLVNVYLNARGMAVNLQPHDVSVVMILMKVARIVTSPNKQDHWTDIAGYAPCGASCIASGQGEPLRA
jgi:hypothetical protein